MALAPACLRACVPACLRTLRPRFAITIHPVGTASPFHCAAPYHPVPHVRHPTTAVSRRNSVPADAPHPRRFGPRRIPFPIPCAVRDSLPAEVAILRPLYRGDDALPSVCLRLRYLISSARPHNVTECQKSLLSLRQLLSWPDVGLVADNSAIRLLGHVCCQHCSNTTAS